MGYHERRRWPHRAGRPMKRKMGEQNLPLKLKRRRKAHNLSTLFVHVDQQK